MLVAQRDLHLFKDGLRSYLLNTQLLRNGGNDQVGFTDRRQVDETDTIDEVLLYLPGNLPAQTGLADTTCPQQCEQADIWMLQQRTDISKFFITSDQRRKGRWYLPHRSWL